MKLFVVIGGCYYADDGEFIVGVFDDEARAGEVSSEAKSIYDMTRVVPLDLNAVRNEEERAS